MVREVIRLLLGSGIEGVRTKRCREVREDLVIVRSGKDLEDYIEGYDVD